MMPESTLPRPLSHCSAPSTTPSPQRAVFGSTRQMSEQPSPAVVFPSSQGSGPTTRPSPQIGKQRDPGTGQTQPASIAAQSAEQPSPRWVLPSSQTSVPPSRPSPHKIRHGPVVPHPPHVDQ